MPNNETALVRLLIFLLGGVLITAAFLVVQINPFEVGLTYLALLASIAAVGLLTNIWGGLLASVVAVFAVIVINQYTGVYPRENYILNVASELAVFLAVGPLGGAVAVLLERLQRRTEHWLRVTEEHTVHDELFGTLKPGWATVRLEEEAQRAVRFQRPLAVALLELEGPGSPSQDERVAALQALIRLTRAATQPPSVIAHAGSGQMLVVLPEHNPAQAEALLAELRERVKTEPYYPPESRPAAQGIGRPLSEWGRLRAGLASLDGQPITAQELISQARQALEA